MTADDDDDPDPEEECEALLFRFESNPAPAAVDVLDHCSAPSFSANAQARDAFTAQPQGWSCGPGAGRLELDPDGRPSMVLEDVEMGESALLWHPGELLDPAAGIPDLVRVSATAGAAACEGA